MFEISFCWNSNRYKVVYYMPNAYDFLQYYTDKYIEYNLKLCALSFNLSYLNVILNYTLIK